MNAGIKIRRNIVSQIFYQVLTIALGITIPRLVLVSLGSEANGLVNSTNQAIVYLALLEGGIGWTITQSLYKPVAENDRENINGILSAANLFYRNVGTWYFVGLVVISAVYTITVKTTLPKATVASVVILTGLPQVINFYFQGKYRTLLSVNGYGYVLTNLSSGTYLLQSIAKIVLLLKGYGLVAIQGMYCVISLIQMGFILYYVRRVFPWIDLRVKPLKEKIGQRSSVFFHQISGFIFSNSDMLVLTYFCSLKVVSVYTMYMMFFSMINTMTGNLTGSMSFLMGQKFNTDRKGFLEIQNKFESLNMVLVFSCYSALCVCILPFLKLYTAGVTDIEYIDALLPFLFTGIQLLQSGRVSYQKVIEYAGKFKETQWHAVVEMIINVVVSIGAVVSFGIYGVLLGTIAALLFRSIMMIYYACTKILNISQFSVYRKWSINILLFVAFQILIRRIPVSLTNYLSICIYGAGVMLMAILVFGLPLYFYDRTSFEYCTKMLKNRFSD